MNRYLRLDVTDGQADVLRSALAHLSASAYDWYQFTDGEFHYAGDIFLLRDALSECSDVGAGALSNRVGVKSVEQREARQ